MNRMAELLERINYDLPGLEKAKMCYAQGDADGAMDAVIEHFRTRTTPKYLFTAKEMEQCKVDGILKDAQETLDHYIYGHKFDGEIDWFFNPTEHTSHDNEWTWSLYRHIYWQPLARAYALTKDEKYTKEFLHEMTEWGKAWPVGPFMENEEDAAAKYKFPGHSWRTIETAMRIYTVWLPCMEAFRTSPAWDREGWVTFLTLLCDHADFFDDSLQQPQEIVQLADDGKRYAAGMRYSLPGNQIRLVYDRLPPGHAGGKVLFRQ